MKNPIALGAGLVFLVSVFCLSVFLAWALHKVINTHGQAVNVEANLTPEQEMRQLRAELDQTKADISKMISDAKINAASVAPNNLNVQWEPMFDDTPQRNPLRITGPDGKSLLVGFRADGVMLWKFQ